MSESPYLVLVLVLLHEVGKAGTHALRDKAWARTPLIDGLPISDLYHGCSGIQWLAVLKLCQVTWGAAWGWWLAAVIAWGAIWPASKFLKYDDLTLRGAFTEAWYWQVAEAIASRLRRLQK